MKTPLYREALAHSWKLAWTHVWLWPLGLFAVFLGQMGLFEFVTELGLLSSGDISLPVWIEVPRLLFTADFSGLATIGAQGAVSLLWLLVVGVGITALILFVSNVSQGALVSIAARSTKSKKLPDIATSWHTGVHHFWRIFTINALKKMSIVLLASLVGLAYLRSESVLDASSVFALTIVMVLALFAGIILSFLSVYAIGYVVVEEYPLFGAIAAAWRLFTGHILVSLEIGLTLLFANLLLGLIALFGIVIFFIPVVVLWMVSLLLAHTTLFGVGMIVGTLLSFFFIVLLGSVFTIFATSTWTYLFMRMHKHGIPSRIRHWVMWRRAA